MVDRKARDQMAAAIRAYMDERTTADELEDSLWDIAGRTKDKAVDAIRQLMWGHYEDLFDHRIIAVKWEWKYFSRLLLILDSDANLELIEVQHPRPFRKIIAGSLLVGYAGVLLIAGLGWAIVVYSLVCGGISMLLYRYASGRSEEPSQLEIALTPFKSIGAIRSLRRRLPGFTRRLYPEAIGPSIFRSPILGRLYAGFMWLLCPPVFLFLQLFPDKVLDTEITVPSPAATAS